MFNNAETKANDNTSIVDILKLKLKQKEAELNEKDLIIKSLKNKTDELLSKLKPYIKFNNERKIIQEQAFKEIFRKEHVIGHKDEKATRLINIIREKNIIIKNLERRVGKTNSINNNINSNWRMQCR